MTSVMLRTASIIALSMTLLSGAGSSGPSIAEESQSAKPSVSYWDLYAEAGKYERGGVGVKRDYRRARDLYLKITRGTDREAKKWAYFALGGLYGRPSFYDAQRSKQYYQAAVDMGELWSAGSLIDLYYKEPRTKANRAKMLELLNAMRESDQPRIRKWARELARRYGLADVKS